MIEQTEILSPLDTKQLNEALRLRLPFSLVTRTIQDGETPYRLTWYFEPDQDSDAWDTVRYNSWDIDTEGSTLADDAHMEELVESILNRIYVLSDDMDLSDGTYPAWFN